MNEKQAMGKLCLHRHNSGLSQLEVALKAGMSPAWLSRMECGRVTVTYKSLCRVAAAMDFTVGFVLQLQGEEV